MDVEHWQQFLDRVSSIMNGYDLLTLLLIEYDPDVPLFIIYSTRHRIPLLIRRPEELHHVHHFDPMLLLEMRTIVIIMSAAVNENLQELQETVSRLSSHKGVEAVLILNRQGDIVAESSGAAAAAQVQKLLQAAKTFVQTLSSPDDEVSFLQLRTQQRRELYVAPHEGYVLAVMKK